MVHGKIMNIMLILLLSFSYLYSYEDKDEEINKNVNSVVNLSIGFSNASSDAKFFEKYNKIIGGFNTEIKTNLNFSFSTKYEFNKKYRIGYSISYLQFSMYDTFEQNINNSGLSTRLVNEDFKMIDFPVLLMFEYNPRQGQQFKTYGGIALGTTVTKMYWNEEINTYDWDKRKGGLRYDELMFFPIIRLYAGTELGFDKEEKQSMLGGITIEPRINYVFRKIDFFSVISNQFENHVNSLNESFWFNNFIFEINFGITINFYHNKKEVQNGNERNI